MTMALFKFRTPGVEHPAYKIGQLLGQRLLDRQHELAQWLNQHQFQHGPYVRNYLLLGLLSSFFLYFVIKIFAVFTF